MKTPALIPFTFTALALLLATPALHAEDAKTYVLAKKGATPAAGATLATKSTSEFGEAKLQVKFESQAAEGTMNNKQAVNEVQEGLAPGKLRRTLTSKTSEQHVVVQGSEQPAPDEADALQGVPVIVEYKDNAWTAKLEEGEAKEDQKKALDELVKQYSNESDFTVYGDKPHKPGDKWDVDPKTFKEFAGMEKLEGKYSVEFVEVKEVRGIACAVIKSTVDLSGTSTEGHEDKHMKMKLKGEILTERSLADMVDLDSKCTATMSGESTLGEGMTMSMEGPFVAETTTTMEKK